MKTVVITGAAGQLGRAFVDRLKSKEDHLIYSLDLKADEFSEDKNVKFVSIDITNEMDVVDFFQSIGGVDVVINNAGVGVFTPFEERTISEFKSVVDVNMLGTFLMCREAIKKMKIAKKGKIINIGSIYGVVSSDFRIYGNSGRNNSEVYTMTKAAVIMLTKYLAAHYAQYNIQINSISPGGILRKQSPDFLLNYKQRTPAGYLASENDLLSTLDYLMSYESRYVNGQNIIVDGGFTAW